MKFEPSDLYSRLLMSDSDMDSLEIVPLGGPDGSDEPFELPEELAILPIRQTVLFPGMVIPVTVVRQKAIRLVKKIYRNSDINQRILGAVTQAIPNKEDPTAEDLYNVGTVAQILKMITLPDGNVTIIVQGRQRFEIKTILHEEPYLTAEVKAIDDSFVGPTKKESKALLQSLRDGAHKIMRLNPEIPQEARIALDNIESPIFLIHFLSSNINVEVADKQKLLEERNGHKQATLLLQYMMREIEMLELKREIQTKASSDIDQQQRDYFLRQQIKVLHDELGMDSPERDLDDIRLKASQKKWSDSVRSHFEKELTKLQRINPMAPEYPVTMNYLEMLVDLPWGQYTKDNFDLVRAQKVLDADHFGLEKVKERIIEYLAVLKLKGNLKAPILCLYGPPGVGKTSLGRSIAKALNREYIRMALGGVHDEAEIRGHRKTYIGAMPGKIIQNIKKAGYANPVFILDEIDKVSSDYRGDPSSALLEVLDPEQNSSFTDNYLEVEYDLSKVLFVATANALDTIHPALRDRMEIIEMTGYTIEEKLQIAKRYLVPKQRKDHGLKSTDIKIDDVALTKIIEGYTRESGVRNLEQKIGSVVRKIAKSVAMEQEYPKTVKAELIEKYLGAEIFDKDLYQDNDFAGVVTGLAWTSVGGEILFIETSLSRGKGNLTLSGQLGDVMKESAVAALSYLKANADRLGIDYRIFNHYDLHVHVPAGAVPKDGPSAGVTMVTSMASIFTQRRVKPFIAMTGEITLRGKVLPVGGVKEKILAARRAGVKEIILCVKNRKDVEEVPANYIKDLSFHYVDQIDEVLEYALLPEKVKNATNFIFPDEKKEKQESGYVTVDA
ncbi:endopeptidase La [Dyadobacter chenwenxiniae]|uniref:Lon protease n=1 Tax=Dyadobacter chenwenxiniae TaxID=2906456 RepID=A0A9X1TEB1_9BACT|nr:endopeptidase La [Dyadobacter chenwenxiniae]MCF0049426.1 endopeptidase La [Dyadobacter chenwenxiniae]MCF0061902.1 endopeptidase La [Dyadobacter chenwenxiniae]UON81717.1 endopeptidase La [Dyadobacter chenwenxiniae]